MHVRLPDGVARGVESGGGIAVEQRLMQGESLRGAEPALLLDKLKRRLKGWRRPQVNQRTVIFQYALAVQQVVTYRRFYTCIIKDRLVDPKTPPCQTVRDE